MIKMIELPYNLNALEPYYSRETLDIHYNVLYKGYVDNTNKTEEKLATARAENNFRKYKMFRKRFIILWLRSNITPAFF